jgi:hypothetical protein
MSRKKSRDMLGDLQQERRRLLRRLTGEKELAVGSVSVVSRKCGNPRCRCARGEGGHEQTLFLFIDRDGRRRCKVIRRADEARIHKAGNRYRQFRQDLQRLRAIDKREKEILMAIRGERALRYK